MNYEEEESYWFLKWIAMRYERNKLRKENQALISQINEISKQ